MPLDAARDGLIELQGQLIGVLAVRNAALAERVAQLEAANAELAERAGAKRGARDIELAGICPLWLCLNTRMFVGIDKLLSLA